LEHPEQANKISKVIAQRSLKKRQISRAKMEDNGRKIRRGKVGNSQTF
jgi:hypothetical protein